jgi:hypothetical protein
MIEVIGAGIFQLASLEQIVREFKEAVGVIERDSDSLIEKVGSHIGPGAVRVKRTGRVAGIYTGRTGLQVQVAISRVDKQRISSYGIFQGKSAISGPIISISVLIR